MPDISWSSESDWDSSEDEKGVDHGNDSYITSNSGTLKQGYANQWPPLTHGLVGWWPLHTEKPVDISGNNHHATKNGGVTTGVAGRGGLQAMSFDGTDDEIENTSTIISGPTDVTISFWFKPRATGGQEVFRSHTGGYTDVTIRYDSGGGQKIFVGFNDSSTSSKSNLVGNTSISPNEWAQVVVTYSQDTDEYNLYVNASHDGSNTGSWDSDVNLYLANDHNNSRYLNGLLSGVCIYNRVLSESEIQTLYEWGSANLASPPTDGVARYALDGDTTDSWGSNDGAANGGLAFSDDAIHGQAASFDGTDDEITGPSGVIGSTTAFTISVWVKSNDSSQTQQRAFRSHAASYQDATIEYNSDGNGEIIFTLTRDTDNTFSHLRTPIAGEDWNFIVATYDAPTQRIYVNGELKNETTFSDWSYAIDVDAIGSNNGGRYFNGLIDDVRIYNRALTLAEIQELYQWGTKGINMNKYTVMQ
jgi:hypothetical protein